MIEQNSQVREMPDWIPDDLDAPGGFSAGGIAKVLSEPGFDIAKATAFVRHCHKMKYIVPYSRARADARRPWLYRTDQVLTAAVLSLMAEAGFSNEAAYAEAARSLNKWDVERPDDFVRSPAMQVIVETLAGKDGWGFELVVARDPKTGQRAFTARVRNVFTNTGTNWTTPTEYVRRSVFAIDLTTVLKTRLFRNRRAH